MEKDLIWNAMAFHVELGALRGYGGGTLQQMQWHVRQQDKFVLHPSVLQMVEKHAPASVQQLAIEFPHVSEKDPTRIAYTRNPEDGERDRQLVTSIGKYLARHWPHVPDHDRRDVQAMFTPDVMHFVHTTPEIIRGIELGPRSCMASVYGSIPFTLHHREQLENWFRDPSLHSAPPWHLHPYSAYRPEYGWSMALRSSGDKIMGRALLLKHADQHVFLRTYKRHPTHVDGWSETDFGLHAWLEAQGFVKVDTWPDGARLHAPMFHDNEDMGRFLPYIDGERKGVNIDAANDIAIITTRGTYHAWCESTDCTPQYENCSDEDDDDYRGCEDCDTRVHIDFATYTGRNGERCVCDNCRDNNYTFVRGQQRWSSERFAEYYVHNDDTGSVERQDYYIDEEYPPDDVVQLENGCWAEADDTVCVEGEYYMDDDPFIVALEEEHPDTGDRCGIKNDCWQDDNGGWWASEEHYLEHNPPDESEEPETISTTEVTA